MSIKVKFSNTIEMKKGKTALKAAKEAGVKIDDSCGGKGKCGKCIIKITEGKVSEPSKEEMKLLGEEKIKKGYRLACMVELEEDTNIKI